jgi:hypothetical protein
LFFSYDMAWVAGVISERAENAHVKESARPHPL